MKVQIQDGCANGGMMDSLSIDLVDEGEEVHPHSFVTEVSPHEWARWEAFLKEHDMWERFWDKKLLTRDYHPTACKCGCWSR